MEYLKKYLEEYGQYSFSQTDINEIDSLIFSQLCYTDLEGIVGCDNELSLVECAKRFYDTYSEEQIADLISISAKAAELLKLCSMTARYSSAIVCHYTNNINDHIDKQFSAVQFILNNGDEVVAFRGTDITVTGVKESAMLSYMFPVPAQIEALHYFQETAMTHTGDIVLCGHSKGGNLAVFAGVNCSNSLKKRLKAIYEYDAPGFPQQFFTRYDYQEIKHKIFFYTPQTSIIGRMLYHDAQSTVIHSVNSGLKQHQVSSWEIEEDHFVMDKYNYTSDLINEYLDGLLDYISDDELELFFNSLEYVAINLGIVDFYDLKELDMKKAFKLIDSLSILEPEQKDKFKQVLKKVSTDFAKLFLKSKKQEYIEKLEQIKPKQVKGEEDNLIEE